MQRPVVVVIAAAIAMEEAEEEVEAEEALQSFPAEDSIRSALREGRHLQRRL